MFGFGVSGVFDGSVDFGVFIFALTVDPATPAAIPVKIEGREVLPCSISSDAAADPHQIAAPQRA